MTSHTLTRIVAPTDDVLTLAEAYKQLRLDTFGSPPEHPEDNLITAEIDAIVADMDAGTGWLGRALAPQTWRVGLTQFPADDCAINIPYPPFIEILSFTYTDDDGNTVTMSEGTDYRVIMSGDQAKLRPVYNGNWPTDARVDYDAILITYRCGYVTGSPEVVAVPELIKNVIRAVLTETYDTRGVSDGSARGQVLDRVINTLANIRVWSNTP